MKSRKEKKRSSQFIPQIKNNLALNKTDQIRKQFQVQYLGKYSKQKFT